MKINAAYNQRERKIYKVTVIGSICNLLLLLFKFVAAFIGHSAAMLADAVHSLSDFVTDVIVLVFVRISNKPQDKGHDYGHGKYETLATALIGVILFGVGLGILWNGAVSVWEFIQGRQLGNPGMVALVAAVASVIIKELLYQYTVFVGRKVRSDAVIANAWHHRSDAFSSVGTAVGIGGAILLGEKWRILDPLAALIVSFFIMKVAYELVIPCMGELMEKSLPDDIEKAIERALLEFPAVSQPHNLRTRKIGNNCSVEVHVRMDGKMTVEQSHEATRAMEGRIKEMLGAGTFVNIHVEPVKKHEKKD